MTGFAVVATVLLLQASVTFTSVAQGTNSGVEEPRQVVVRSAGEWQELWKEHGARTPPPAVDFSKSNVVAVFLGSRPTGGYRVTITGATSEDGGVVVEYAERRPGRGDIVTQILTSPFHIVAIPATGGEVSFRKVQP